MATMDDIAKSLGISKGTVSKALSGAEDISETMRRTVVERAVELGYTRVRRSGMVGRVCIFVLHMAYEQPDDFGYDVVVGFRKLAEPVGYSVDVIALDDEQQRDAGYDEYMLRHNYQGALFLGLSDTDPWRAEVAKCVTPTVLYDNLSGGNPAVTQIGVDNFEAMLLSVSYLRELGHERIGYLSSGDMHSFIYMQRCDAYREAMRRCGLSFGQETMGVSPYTADCLREHLPRLIESGVTAILCNHDILAQAVVVHCAELGIAVPEQLSVIGFDDIPICQYTKPALTTIRQNRTELGKSAFYALRSQLNQTPIGLLLLHAELVVRGSSGPRPGNMV